MNPGRPIIAAAQVIVVGVLVVIVYTNFLRPGDDGDLSGVDAPGGPEVTQSAEPKPDRTAGPGGTGKGARVRASQPVVAAPTGVEPIAGEVPSPGPPSGPPAPAGEGPTDDQYLDAVARLTVKLN